MFWSYDYFSVNISLLVGVSTPVKCAVRKVFSSFIILCSIYLSILQSGMRLGLLNDSSPSLIPATNMWFLVSPNNLLYLPTIRLPSISFSFWSAFHDSPRNLISINHFHMFLPFQRYIIITPRLYSPSRARACQQTAGLASTCPETSERSTGQFMMHVEYQTYIQYWKKSVAYSSQGSHTGQLYFCNWLADDSTTGWCD